MNIWSFQKIQIQVGISVCACVVIGDSVAQLGDDINKGLNPLRINP